MKIDSLQNEIEHTEYWDMPILDIQILYFGDEVHIYIENDEETCWKISFMFCYQVSYETDADWRTINSVKEMIERQLGYFGQDISLKEYEANKEFIQCNLDLTIVLMKIICKNILVEKINMDDIQFFWQKS